ncbi:uncharacterized protein LOC117336714 [Pecten maximus]|uniref:uncharacterized protein LOC117336714 n=1 Tax=Pecten maximus TaxID=6579 RepID=UPI001457ED2D|nr:uncharacterized protein LOC117336714 [Pecten maximus]
MTSMSTGSLQPQRNDSLNNTDIDYAIARVNGDEFECSTGYRRVGKERRCEGSGDSGVKALVPENLSVCPAWFYGVNCTEMCSCNQTTSVSCNSANGSCICTPGHTGNQCNQACDSNTFGENCSQTCKCDPINSFACSHVDGTCDCSSGWTGNFCNETCSAGTYGDQCRNNCSCPTNASPVCHHINGSCSCITDYVMVGDTCLKIDTVTVTVSPLSEFLAVFENPVYVCIITVGCTLLLVAIILCIMWIVCRCSCAEVRSRKHLLKSPTLLDNVPTAYPRQLIGSAAEPAKKDAIAALANITTKSIKQEEELDVHTSTVYGASLGVTGQPPITEGGSYYYNETLQQSFPSTTPLLDSSSQVNIIDNLLDGNAYFQNTKASSVSTFKLNETTDESPQTVNTIGGMYYNVDDLQQGILNRKLVASQPNLSQQPRPKDVTFNDVIADIAKKKGYRNGKTNLKKMNSRSLPNINRVNVEPDRVRPTFHLFKNSTSDPDMKQKQSGNNISIYEDTAVSNSKESRDVNAAATTPMFIGAKKATRIAPIPVAPPLLPPKPKNVGNSVLDSSESKPSSDQPSPPPISKIPTYSNINRNGMPRDDTKLNYSASDTNFQNVPVAPPFSNIPLQNPSFVRGGNDLRSNATGGVNYDDVAIRSFTRQESEGIYDDIDQDPGRVETRQICIWYIC